MQTALLTLPLHGIHLTGSCTAFAGVSSRTQLHAGLATDPAIVRAVTAIREGKLTKRADGHLELPLGITWSTTGSNVLFVLA